jgi:putative peptide zinc metalloprotease protein
MTKARLSIALLALVAALSLGAVAYAATFTTAKGNNAEAEAAGAPGTSVIDLALGMRENDTDVVDEANSAFAHSTCDDCRSVAIAFQVVIVQSRPSTVTPANVAVALNENCNACSSLAIAHQFVVGKGEPARITKSGRRQLAAVGDDLLRLERSYEELPDAEIQARADADAAKVREILDTELVPAKRGGAKPDYEDKRLVDRAA